MWVSVRLGYFPQIWVDTVSRSRPSLRPTGRLRRRGLRGRGPTPLGKLLSLSVDAFPARTRTVTVDTDCSLRE